MYRDHSNQDSFIETPVKFWGEDITDHFNYVGRTKLTIGRKIC